MRAERTKNMLYMVVTLDVSKLSGWLNADAYCEESNGGYTMRACWREAAGDRAARRVQDSRLGAGHGRSAP